MLEIWIILFLLLPLGFCQDVPLVETSKGSVIGLKVKSEATSADYFSFRGIPYAAPPVGELRFKAPTPALNWSTILDARHDKNACMQISTLEPFSLPTSEDCLYLNVYTPYLKIPDGKSLLPVMVYIHGGGFFKGSSDSRLYGPDFFMQEEIVLVTMNYRLGIFGFLNLEIPEAQGNAGLKDLILALKWVQREIKSFGGNPDSVTIFGNSAGGSAVHCLYLSPMSQGLFQKAISQSGTAHKLKISQSNYNNALELTNKLNCNASSVEAVFDCLKTADAKQIISVQLDTPDNNEKLLFQPTFDKNVGEEAFLPEDLTELNIKKYSKAPYLIGVTKKEGIYKLKAKNYTKELENLETFLPLSIQQSSQQTRNDAVKKLEQFYFNSKPFSNDTINGAIDLYTDQYLYSAIETVRTLQPRTNVFLYQFVYDGDIKFLDQLPLIKQLNITGASHTDEIGYLFYSQHLKQNISSLPNDVTTISRMVRLWTNFAKFGDPTPDTSDNTLGGVKWSPVSKHTTRHLQIGKELIMVDSDLEPERISFWDSFNPTSGSIVIKCNLYLVFFISMVKIVVTFL